MRELNEKELLNVSGGALFGGYADALHGYSNNLKSESCKDLKKKKKCEKQAKCAWSETAQCQYK